MPWTLSHPAAVLPLRRLTPQPLSFVALVVGSMTPDIGYYIGSFKLATFAHTLPGVFGACLPTGIIMLVVFYLFSRPVCYALPSPHRQVLLPLCPDFPRGLKQWAIILISVLLGAWTHTFWDAFTHKDGWFVERIPSLQQPVTQLGSLTVHMYLVLQEASTVVGFVIVAFAYWWWLHRRQANLPAATESDGWRYLFWLAIIVLSLLICVPAAIYYATSASLHDFLFFRSFVFRVAIYSPAVFVPLSLIGTAVIYSRRAQ